MSENSDQLAKMLQAFQSFGLNIIQSMGEMKSIISRLEQRIENLEVLLLKIKSLEVPMHELSTFKDHFDSEIHELKSIIKTNAARQSRSSDANQSATKNPFSSIEHPKMIFETLLELLDSCGSSAILIEYLTQAKDRLFILTGGHVAIFDIQRTAQSLKNASEPFSDVISSVREKIKSWISLFT
jgi:hypothetical protein